MRTTYITRMPDEAGAFLKASRAISACGGNIVRVSYNKALDVHTLFIEVDACADCLAHITEELRGFGYLAEGPAQGGVLLVSLTLPDVPGALVGVLEVLERHRVNISYMSAHENGTPFQQFKMGLLVEDPHAAKLLLDEVSRLCPVSVLERGVTEKALDATVFYIGFANEMRGLLGLTQDETNDVLVSANRIMQQLDERGEAPLEAFDCIARLARFVVGHAGAAFRPNVVRRRLTERVGLCAIEPPCGSSTYVLEDAHDGSLLVVDCGFACYEAEMQALFDGLFPGFADRPKRLALTHGDIDHAGLAHLFDEVLLTAGCAENIALQHAGAPDFREQNPLHAPYSVLSKLVSGYRPCPLDTLRVVGARTGSGGTGLEYVGSFSFGCLAFEMHEGPGGHVRGETVIACPAARLAFTGDLVVNIAGFSEDQRAFNVLAPYLMTSVNVDSQLASATRAEVMRRFGGYLLCPGHGPVMDPAEADL